MRTWRAISASLQLLSDRDRLRLSIATGVQMLTGFLDAAGVALFGAVAAIATSAVSGQPLPEVVQGALAQLGLSTGDNVLTAVWLSVAGGLLLILKSILNVLLTRRVLRFLAFRQALVSGVLVEKLLARPLLQLQQRTSQETSFALTVGVSAAMLGVLGQGITVITELSLLGILALGLLAVDPVVAFFAIGFFVAVAFILQRVMSTRGRRLGEINSEAEIASTALVQETLATYREVLVTHRRNLYVDQFQVLRWRSASVQSGLSIMTLVPKYVFEIALVVGAGLLAWTQFASKDATAAMATIAIFLAASSRIVPSMLRLQGSLLGIRVNSGMARPTIELAGELEASTAENRTSMATTFSGAELAQRIKMGHLDFEARLETRGLSVSYDQGLSYALTDVSLNVPAGTSVALVGPTGAGKSSLADAILGVVRPEAGQVLIGGLPPLEAISRWPGGMAYVPQEVAMTPGSIRENVALGLPRESIDDERAWEALERAKLATYLREVRQGLDTVVGESGVRLSGGQRQRLGIARALYARPRLLVLDEATSALDAETEQAIVDTLQALEGEVTTVTVAHRLATIRHCDVVVYLEAGRLIFHGTFDEVVANVPAFATQARIMGLS